MTPVLIVTGSCTFQSVIDRNSWGIGAPAMTPPRIPAFPFLIVMAAWNMKNPAAIKSAPISQIACRFDIASVLPVVV
jgi:hypothetical protein